MAGEGNMDLLAKRIALAGEAFLSAKLSVTAHEETDKGSNQTAVKRWTTKYQKLLDEALEAETTLKKLEGRQSGGNNDRDRGADRTKKLTPSGVPVFVYGPSTTRREVLDYVKQLAAFFKGKGFDRVQQGEERWVQALLTVVKNPAHGYLEFVQKELVDPGLTWEEASALFVDKFGVIKDSLGPARRLLNRSKHDGKVATAAHVEEHKRRVIDTFPDADANEGWERTQPVFQQLLIDSLPTPLREAVNNHPTFEAKVEDEGYDGIGKLAVQFGSAHAPKFRWAQRKASEHTRQ